MNIIHEKFFTRAISFKPETCEAVKALDASFKAGHWEQALYSRLLACTVDGDSRPSEEGFYLRSYLNF